MLQKQAALLVGTGEKKAESLVSAAEAKATSVVDAAKAKATAAARSIHADALKAKAGSEKALQEAKDSRELAKQSATGVMANAQRESAKILRQAHAKAKDIAAQNLALESKIEGLKLQVADLAAPLREGTEHCFTAGGCTFHVSTEALEAHPDGYLSVLARSPMSTKKNKGGAYEIHDITAKELKSICHFLNTGALIGPLAKRDQEARELMARFGSENAVPAVLLTREEDRALKLDPAKIRQHCPLNKWVEQCALEWANKLARELPHAGWADGTRLELGDSYWTQKDRSQTDLFRAKADKALVSYKKDWEQPFSRWQAASKAVQRWFDAADLAPPSFALQNHKLGTKIFVTFHDTDEDETDESESV